eukprot:2392119-Amphidinium_carterae.1
MITRGQLRPRGSYNGQHRGTTPQPRQQVQHEENMRHDFFPPKIEDVNDLTGQEYFDEYFAEEAAKEDDIENIEDKSFNVMGFNKLLQYSRKLLRLRLSLGRLCDDWRRRPIRGTLQFVQRHEHDLKPQG